MKTRQITIAVSGEETRVVDAYPSEAEGLYVHRQLVWVPAAGEHKFVSKWVITHGPTGRSLLHPSQSFSTMASAMRLCESLNDFNWTTKEAPAGSYSAVSRNFETLFNQEQVGELAKSTRYIIRKVEGGYGVVDSVTDMVIEKFVHRGLASAAARDMNEKESV